VSTDKPNILVVDDEPQITRVLKTTLAGHGYSILTARDGDEAMQLMKGWAPDLIITDLRMPNMDGVALCRHVRSTSAIPVIVLSVRGEERAKIEALDAGADDYVTKPFSVNELLARVRAALRRAAAPKKQEQEAAAIEDGDFRIDFAAHSVHVKNREVKLTPKEFDLLAYLARHPGKVITHRVLLASVWPETGTAQPEYLRVFVGHLRKKLEPDEKTPRYIITEPWVGYRFNPSGQP